VAGVPVIDIAPLAGGVGHPGATAVGVALDEACSEAGFFYVVGHGVASELRARLDDLARQFFALREDEKAEISMARAGRAWRGWFPLGGELTSGVPDLKEGIYFGAELDPDDPRVSARCTEPISSRAAPPTWVQSCWNISRK
jgi:isopenicillin N synthase-like dioxygenase